MEQKIVAIVGKPGLYKLLSRGRATVIVEALNETHKRFPVGLHDRVSSLEDISIYTTGEDTPLYTVFRSIVQSGGAKPIEINPAKASSDELYNFLSGVLPNFDRDRVHPSDIKKIILWFNTLVVNGITDFPVAGSDENPSSSEAKPAE